MTPRGLGVPVGGLAEAGTTPGGFAIMPNVLESRRRGFESWGAAGLSEWRRFFLAAVFPASRLSWQPKSFGGAKLAA